MAQYQSDRNLLFGVIAIQMDFITRDALIAAMNAWVLEKDKPLGQFWSSGETLARTSLPCSTRSSTSMSSGTAATPSRAWQSLSLGELDAARPAGDADPDLDASVAHLGAAAGTTDPMETLPPSVGSSSSRPDSGSASCGLMPAAGWARSTWPGTRSSTARWPSRRSRTEHADDPDSRARFLLEAEITGGLEHPGIVPVYGLGHDADGRPFYAMRFIRGDTLKEAIERFHRADSGARPRPRRAGAGAAAVAAAGSSTSATPWPTPTAAACCTAISSRAT